MINKSILNKPIIPFIVLFLICDFVLAFAPYEVKELYPESVYQSTTDLELEMTVDNPIAEIGAVLNFTIEISNKGPGNANNMEVLANLPVGYTFIDATVTSGTYDNLSGVWLIKQLASGENTLLRVSARLLNYESSLYLAEIMICDEEDPDSSYGNGVDTDGDGNVVDDPDDEDDGDGQNIEPLKNIENNSNVENTNKLYRSPEQSPTGIRTLLTDHKNRIQTYFFDHNSIAMRVEFDPKEKQKPMFFDNNGYVYTEAKNQGYYKTPFAKIMKLMKNMNSSLINNAENNYGIDVGPNKFPVLEWAFTYNMEAFRNKSEITEENVSYRGNDQCTKFLVNSGKNRGSFVIFDSQGRLLTINTNKQGSAEYFYENHSVTIPPSQEAPGLFNLFGG